MEANIPLTDRKRIIIAGGGFAGLQLCKSLRKSDYQVVLIDSNNFHQFQPLFYQVATAGLEPSSISFPFRKIFQDFEHFHFRYGKVTAVHPDSKKLETTFGDLHYDYFVIATGAQNNFFGNQHIAERSFPMKSIGEALALRNTIFENFEKAVIVSDPEERQQYLNIVIVGGGPTGVEVAGTLAEMKRYILPKDYPDMDFGRMQIMLLEGAPKVLNGMSEKSSSKALKYLNALGVEVRLNTLVANYDGSQVFLRSGETINSRILVWAAGVSGNLIRGIDSGLIKRGGRILVNEFNEVPECEGVLALGDIAFMQADPIYPDGHPQLAQVAIQQAKNLGDNFNRLTKSKKLKAFKYKNLGSMATVGRNKAVVDLPKYSFGGFFAWLVWMLVHLRSILGAKNKFLIFINWVWSYITYNLSLRLIIQRPDRSVLNQENSKSDVNKLV